VNPSRRAIALLLTLFVGFASGAEFTIRVWDTDDGLPSSSVIAIAQARDGYLWLGTLNGLVRFDGIRFTVFDPENTPALNDTRIVSLFADSAGTLWIGTMSGSTVMMRDGRFTAPGEMPAGGSDRRLVAACEDADGNVWLYKANSEVWRYDGQRFTGFVVHPNEGVPKTIIKEPHGPVWVATDIRQSSIAPAVATMLELPVSNTIPAAHIDRLVPGRQAGYWRLADGRIEHWTGNRRDRDYGNYPWPPGGVLMPACEDQDGNLLVGTQGAGVYQISRENGTILNLSTNNGLSHSFAVSLLVDREGTLWVGTDGGGLNRVKRQTFSTVPETRGWVAQSVSEDATGRIWMASSLEGLTCWSNGVVERFGVAGGALRFSKAVFADRDQRVWVGAPLGLARFEEGHFELMPVHQVQAILQDHTGTMWFGTAGGLTKLEGTTWKTFTTSNGLSSDAITSIAEDSAGDLWVGTRGGGINRFHGERLTPIARPDAAAPDDIAELLIDRDGVLWASTFANGLLRFHDGKWSRCSVREGLVSNNLGYLVDGTDDVLWIGSNAGVLRVSKSELRELAERKRAFVQCRAYRKADGLPTAECSVGSQPGAVRDNHGRLWFPTVRGVAFVDPVQLRPNTNPPPVSIESVLIDNKAAPLAGGVTLRPDNERLEIQYASLNLSAPERALFRYRLENHETEWIEAGNSRVAHYSKLPPGNYTFHVIACNEDGVWNEAGSRLGVIVHPPVWRTWWFITAMALAAIGSIAGAVYLVSTQRYQRELAVLRQQEALEKERARIARDIHDQVGASLTQVALLGELVETDKDSPADVGSHAQQICQTARETTRALDEIVWTVNPQNDTLEGLVNYICKYAQDYLGVAGIKYRLEVPAQVPDAPIAPDVRHNVFLASKEAVTNIVRHAQAKAAWVRVQVAPERVIIEVEDKGRGLGGLDPQAARLRHGLSNMRKRMEEVGGTFSLEPGRESGALVRLTVPLKTQNVTG